MHLPVRICKKSGFIAAKAALALNEANCVLVPENTFDLDGPNGLYSYLEKRLQHKGHAVIVVSEGAGGGYLQPVKNNDNASDYTDKTDIGLF